MLLVLAKMLLLFWPCTFIKYLVNHEPVGGVQQFRLQ